MTSPLTRPAILAAAALLTACAGAQVAPPTPPQATAAPARQVAQPVAAAQPSAAPLAQPTAVAQATTAAAVGQVPLPADCNKPVMLVVWIENLDRAKSAPYGAALRSSQIVKRHHGTYKAVSPPMRVLEGEWPAERGFVVERYPCLAVFEQFWYSDEYQQKIKPLRDGSGEYTVVLFEER